jgi:hypothetical protein
MRGFLEFFQEFFFFYRPISKKYIHTYIHACAKLIFNLRFLELVEHMLAGFDQEVAQSSQFS